MSDIFDPSVTFQDLGLSSDVLKGATDAGFKHPTDIQAKLIPTALTGKDVIGQAKTGTGKTASFGLPLLNQAKQDEAMQALVMVPTRELAVQVAADAFAKSDWAKMAPNDRCVLLHRLADEVERRLTAAAEEVEL